MNTPPATKEKLLREVPDTCYSVPKDIYILELYSGHGRVSWIASRVLGRCPVETVDMSDELGHPTITACLPEDAVKVVAELQRRHPNRRPVIWASPDCTHLSVARTTGGPRDLQRADAMVSVIDYFAKELEALVVVVENPATGLLKDRESISFAPYRYEVNYCMYGKPYCKPTALWCTRDLTQNGFAPKTCDWACDACFRDSSTGQKRHVMNVQDLSLAERVSVPDNLVSAVFRAIRDLVETIKMPVPTRFVSRARPTTSINVVWAHRVADDGSKVEISVTLMGCDGRRWVPMDEVHMAVEDLPYFDLEAKAHLARLMNLAKFRAS